VIERFDDWAIERRGGVSGFFDHTITQSLDHPMARWPDVRMRGRLLGNGWLTGVQPEMDNGARKSFSRAEDQIEEWLLYILATRRKGGWSWLVEGA